MIASAHIAAGLVSGMAAARFTEKLGARVGIAFGVGLLTHVMLDALPHSDYAPLSRHAVMLLAFSEIFAMTAIGIAMLRPRVLDHWPGSLLPGLAGATLPDLKFFARVFLPKNMEVAVEHYGNYLHSFFHAAPTSPPLGWTVEIFCLVALLGILAAFPRRSPGRGRTLA